MVFECRSSSRHGLFILIELEGVDILLLPVTNHFTEQCLK